jgi:hypothetical protein
MATAAAQSGEIGFYCENGVRVTSTRLLVGSTTYAMANITSVRTSVAQPSRKGPLLVILVGLVLLLIAANSHAMAGMAFVSALIIAGGIFWWTSQKAIYAVRIASSSGESSPITSVNEERIDRIVQAINEAIVHRG